MKKLLFLAGLLVFALFVSATPVEVDFDTGIYFEQSQDFEVIVDESATILNIDFLIIDYSLKEGFNSFSPGNRFENAFIEADKAFNNILKENPNYFYREIERETTRPPITEANTQFYNENNYSSTKDGFKLYNKNIFGFWLC